MGDATFAFGEAVSAFGVLIGNVSSESLEIFVDGASVGRIEAHAVGFEFIGIFDLETPFSSVSIRAGDSAFEIEDVTFGPV